MTMRIRVESGIHSSTFGMIGEPENPDLPWPRSLRAAIWFGLAAVCWIALASLFYLLWTILI